MEEDIVPNQVHSWDKFIEGLDLVVIMVGHDDIKEKLDQLDNVLVLDTRNICDKADNIYKL